MSSEYLAFLRTTKQRKNCSVSEWINIILNRGEFDFERLRKEFSPYIHLILNDCDVKYNMTYEEARDSIRELSLLATVYVNSNSGIYTRITDLIRTLIASYPVRNFEWKQPTDFVAIPE